MFVSFHKLFACNWFSFCRYVMVILLYSNVEKVCVTECCLVLVFCICINVDFVLFNVTFTLLWLKTCIFSLASSASYYTGLRLGSVKLAPGTLQIGLLLLDCEMCIYNCYYYHYYCTAAVAYLLHCILHFMVSKLVSYILCLEWVVWCKIL